MVTSKLLRLFTTKVSIAGAVALWAVAVAVGVAAMLRYETTPGETAAAPKTWPAGTTLARPEDRPTLLMFVHPRCPCTAASMAQLSELMVGVGQPVTAYVILFMPFNAGASWSETDAWRRVSTMTGVTAVRDENGAEASRFGARTSGQVLVFDAAGSVVFDGGITAGRGRTGENPGSLAVAAVLQRRSPTTRQTPVFGCELLGPEACALCEGDEKP